MVHVGRVVLCTLLSEYAWQTIEPGAYSIRPVPLFHHQRGYLARSPSFSLLKPHNFSSIESSLRPHKIFAVRCQVAPYQLRLKWTSICDCSRYVVIIFLHVAILCSRSTLQCSALVWALAFWGSVLGVSGPWGPPLGMKDQTVSLPHVISLLFSFVPDFHTFFTILCKDVDE